MHTEEPWHVKIGVLGASSTIHKHDDEHFIIAHVVCEDKNATQRSEDIANANLMAAAPEMFKTLMQLLDEWEREHRVNLISEDTIDMASRAVRKAMGK